MNSRSFVTACGFPSGYGEKPSVARPDAHSGLVSNLAAGPGLKQFDRFVNPGVPSGDDSSQMDTIMEAELAGPYAA